jgi:hypothetical protein
MRVALVAQWLRAAHANRDGRRTALRKVAGVSLCMVGWGLILLTHGTPHLVLFFVMVALELAVPPWAERSSPTPWHPHHIAERYGLLFIIVLGEIVLSTTLAVQAGFVQDRLWWRPAAWSSSSPSGGCTSTNPSTAASSTTGTPSSGATVTTSSSPPRPRSGPASRSSWTTRVPRLTSNLAVTVPVALVLLVL